MTKRAQVSWGLTYLEGAGRKNGWLVVRFSGQQWEPYGTQLPSL